jgi:hypothetical protein
MNYTIEGKVLVVTETTQITEKFAKREIVIETDDKYPQQVMLEFSQENVNCWMNAKLMTSFKSDSTFVAGNGTENSLLALKVGI